MPTGSETIAESLKALDIKHIFGIVGIPVIEVAEACKAAGIHFISFRNEQSAVYAASVYGYLTGKPGVALVVGGPGVVHALAGVENANANRFPFLLLAGSAETSLRGMGAFQQLDQVSLLRASGAKFAEQPASLGQLSQLIREAYQICQYGRPGTAYIDLPADLITASISTESLKSQVSQLSPPLPPPKYGADPALINAAVLAIKQAKFPLLIVGKGCSWSYGQVRKLQSVTNLAFIPTPMGKGVISDHVKENLSAARSLTLKSADVIIVLGARLNWILHFGKPPKYSKDVQFFQCSNVPEDIASLDNNVGLVGDVGLVAQQLVDKLGNWKSPAPPASVLEKREANEIKATKQESEQKPGSLLQYHPVYAQIRSTLEANAKGREIVYVSEGANTMDISRSSFPLASPRQRIDAGTNATMGVGMGYAIAAKISNPLSIVVAIEGDSAFGFSAMEIETAVRTGLPMIIYIMNNSGVYHGADPILYHTNGTPDLPTTALSLNTKYHDLAVSLGAVGYEVSTLKQLEQATSQALKSNQVALINVIIDPAKDKKLEFAWMSKM